MVKKRPRTRAESESCTFCYMNRVHTSDSQRNRFMNWTTFNNLDQTNTAECICSDEVRCYDTLCAYYFHLHLEGQTSV